MLVRLPIRVSGRASILDLHSHTVVVSESKSIIFYDRRQVIGLAALSILDVMTQDPTDLGGWMPACIYFQSDTIRTSWSESAPVIHHLSFLLNVVKAIQNSEQILSGRYQDA